MAEQPKTFRCPTLVAGTRGTQLQSWRGRSGRAWFGCATGALLWALLSVSAARAGEPGTGIAVDGQGVVHFTDIGQGPWKIDATGKVTAQDGPPSRFLALDAAGRLAGVRLPASSKVRLKHAGSKPTLILSDDVPIAIAGDGGLFFPDTGEDGRVQIVKLQPSGAHTVLATLPATTEDGPLQSINGIAVGRDGSVYYTENKAIRRLTREGTIATVASSVVIPDCVQQAGADEKPGPHLRGIAVEDDGAILVAANGCGAVARISAQGEVTTLLRAVSPWSPAGVALRGSDVYVLEYLHQDTGDARAWLPRVRKVSKDGRISLLAEIRRR